MRFYIADAFSNTLFGGNPAGVVLLENGQPFPSDETMRKRQQSSDTLKPHSSDSLMKGLLTYGILLLRMKLTFAVMRPSPPSIV